MLNIRPRRGLWLAAPALAALAALALSVPAQAQTQAQIRPASARHTSAAPVATSTVPLSRLPRPGHGRPRIVRDPIAYRQALRSGRWTHTPEGLASKGCLYHAPEGAVMRDGRITSPSGAVRKLRPCVYPTLAYPASVRAGGTSVGTAGGAPGTVANSGSACTLYSTYWFAESCNYEGSTWVVDMAQEQAVPSDPATSGALIFLWGGLENAGQNTLLQDVLTWGANADTGVTNPDIWYVTPWYLWSNYDDYVTGPNMHVQVSDTIEQTLNASDCNGSGDCTWDLRAVDKTTGQSVSYTVGSGVPFDYIIGAVMEVPRADGCVETPASGHAAFRDLEINGNNGALSPSFGTSYPDSQCSVSIKQTSTSADILWKP